MRNLIIGLFIGAILAFSSSVYADVSEMIGKKVEGTFSVKIDGKSLGDAVIVDGTSYAPVRAISEAVGLNVSFSQEEGIKLEKKDYGVKAILPPESTMPTAQDIENQKNKIKKFNEMQKQTQELQKQIVDLNKIIAPYEKIVRDNNKAYFEKDKDETYFETKKQRDDLVVQRDALEKQRQDLVNQELTK